MTVVGAGSRGFGSSPKRPSLLQKTNEPAGNLSQVSAQPVTAHRPPALCSHTALCLYPSCPDTTHPTHCWLTQPSTCLPFPFPSQPCLIPPTHTHTLSCTGQRALLPEPGNLLLQGRESSSLPNPTDSKPPGLAWEPLVALFS